MIRNPFPGPQPYRPAERACFFGRDDLARRLESSIGANRCVSLFGPSGAGKSSLLQAVVLPNLIESNDVRVVHVDSWPEPQDPTRWLASAIHDELRQGSVPVNLSPSELVLLSVKRAARSSPRLLVVVLDQIEQILDGGRDPSHGSALFECIDDVLSLPLSGVHVVISLREDYLGRLRERLRDRDHLLRYGFRVAPLTVAELTRAACQAAAAGAPAQTWVAEEVRALMLQVRAPGSPAADSSEAQAAYAQIVCRALFERRALHDGGVGAARAGEAPEAEPILHEYLDNSLDALGPLREDAERILEDHLVTADGGRTIRTEQELLHLVTRDDLDLILGVLEGTAILRAEEHQGRRYFEIGNDWLAHKVAERRRSRETQRALREREEALDRELVEAQTALRQREEALGLEHAEAEQQRAELTEVRRSHQAQARALDEARRRGDALALVAAVCALFAAASGLFGALAYRAARGAGEVHQCEERGPRPAGPASASPR